MFVLLTPKIFKDHPYSRLYGVWRGEEAEGTGDEGAPVHYWITSSARASIEGGIVTRCFGPLRRWGARGASVVPWKRTPVTVM
jgi:hypothetical protein